jgi:hypothetical protein
VVGVPAGQLPPSAGRGHQAVFERCDVGLPGDPYAVSWEAILRADAACVMNGMNVLARVGSRRTRGRMTAAFKDTRPKPDSRHQSVGDLL